MEVVIQYFVKNFEHLGDTKVDLEIIKQINKMHRTDRILLRNRIFEQAEIIAGTTSGAHVVRWLNNCFKILDRYSFRFNEVFFSPGNEIKNEIIKLLGDSTSTVDLCVFTITDEELANQIIACYKRGVKVRIITDDEKINDRGSEIFDFERVGIPVKTDNSQYHMHNKFGIIDNRIAITGSFNWTYTATKHNQENLLATSKFEIVKQYSQEFERLWNEMQRL